MITIETDVLVVGGGIAGCAAAFTSARRSKTLLVSAGGSATSLSTGCIDFRKQEGRERSGPFLEAIERAGLQLAEGGHVITYVGLDRHSDIRQAGMLTLEELKGSDGVAVVHLPWLKASHAKMTAHGLRTMGIAADVLVADDAVREKLLDGCGASELGASLAEGLPSTGRQLIAVPALWGRPDAYEVLRSASKASGREFRELVGPVGPQGLRLQRAAEGAVGKATVMMGTEIVSLEFEKARCVGARLRSGLRELRVRCASVVMATGGPLITRPEVDLGLDVRLEDVPPLGAAPFLLSRNGRACLRDMELRNVAICGSADPGIDHLQGSGMGDCILSGIAAVETLEAGR
jgi:anaerobic glycerol-3-phosphate dehydrogenase